MWRGTPAVGADATLSHDDPQRPLTRLHSCCAGGRGRGDVRLWPRGPTAPAVSQTRCWTDHKRPAPPADGRGRGRLARLTAPRRLVAAAASAPPTSCDRVAPQRPFGAVA